MKRKALYGLALALALIAAAGAVVVGCSDSPTQPRDQFAECGTIQGLACPTGQTCELPAGECNVDDLGGTCVQIPDLCTQDFVPVCGCDGKTYGNDCERLAARVQKSHDGECT